MALTKISGGVIQQPINVGIITATSADFSGIVTARNTLDAQGNVTVGAGLSVVGVSTFTTLKVGTAVTISSGIISATSFYGDGTNLTNTGSTLSAASGSQRVVLTGQTSGTMTASATDSALTYTQSTGILSATKFSGDGSALTGIAVTANVRSDTLVVSGVSTFTTVLVGTGVTINSGIVTATTVRASSVSATGGTTAQRPTDAVTGTIRYNTVFGYLEYFDGTHWLEINASGYRGVFGGGSVYPGGSPFTAPASGTIDYLTIAALGDAIDFGDLTVTTNRSSAVASSTRGVFGATAFSNNILDYITISTTGNALDFGDDLNNPLCGATCNETRGLWGGGYIHNAIRYITIASTGNTTDFGDLLEQKWATMDGSVASPTRGIFAGGSAFAPTKTNRIEYVTISSTGNSTNFGDLIQNSAGQGSCSSSTRGVFAVANGNIDYITIASTGNSVDFGGGSANFTNGSAASNNIRGVFAGGYIHNSMYHITISTTGDAVNFGDLTTLNRWVIAGCSNGHGGLQ